MSAVIGSLKPFDPAVDDFEVWCSVFKTFLLANEIDETKKHDQCRAIFLSNIGLSTYSTLSSLLSPDDPNTKQLADLIDALQKHYKPAPKAIAERFKFAHRRQQPGESVHTYLAELRKLATTCKFKNLDESLRDQFICGLSSVPAQKHCFGKDDNVKLDEVVQVALSHESAEFSAALVRDGQVKVKVEAEVHKSSFQSKKSQKSKGHPSISDTTSKPQQSSSRNTTDKSKTCPNCGSKSHTTAKECPHKDVECHNCGKKGHFRKYCRSQKKEVVTTRNIHQVRDTLEDQIMIEVKVDGHPHQMELDTGAGKGMLSEKFWKSIGSPKLQHTKYIFRTYTGEVFHPIGDLQCKFMCKNKEVDYSVPVVKGPSLFGRDMVRQFKFKLVQCNKSAVSSLNLQTLTQEYSDLFSSPTGRITGFKAKIQLKEDAIPKFLKARPLPFALRAQVEKELDAMENQGHIERIEHSDWASPIVVVRKANGKIRITGDFSSTVNNQLHITQYPLATPEDLFSSISGGEKFSKLDGVNAYHQMEVEESCKKFLVINTHKGLFRYNVLPQGIASSPAIFQEFMDELMKGIPMSGSYIDDGLCSGKSDAEHLETLKIIFERMRKCNYRLSKEKCELLRPKIEYLGHVITKDGIHTSPSKVEAVQAIQKPVNVTELRSFLGLINFYGKFLPFLSDICVPLYQLTRNDSPWRWTSQCQKSFEEVKSMLSSAEVLAHHDPSVRIGISADASSVGAGIVIFHRYEDGTERPIAYCSKILSDTEKRYSQIEKEALSIIIGVKKYFKFLCGRRFILVTDHRPLLAIFGSKKNLQPYAATRLHHWSLYLSQFCYDIEYRNTKDHGNADALSRLPTSSDVSEIEDIDCQVNLIASEQMEVLPITAKSIATTTSRDKELSEVHQFIMSGWPNHMEKAATVYPFYLRKDELSITQGVIMWGIRTVIPSPLRKKLLEELHSSHSGIVRMKSLARQYIWWPNIDEDIEQLCKQCTQCCENRHSPASAPLHPWEFPEKPWQRIHMDLAGPLHGKMWLLVVDAHSKWPEIFCMNQDTTSTAIIRRVRETVCRFGIPDQIVTDNGRQFTSQEFETYCRNNGIRHTTSSAYHPRSNGAAERLVQTFKEAMKHANGDLEFKLQQFLFTYRITPHATTGVSPSELLQGRKLKTMLDQVRPNVNANVNKSQHRQCLDYNKRVKSRSLQVSQKVWVQTYSKNLPKWTLGTVIKILGPVTYLVFANGFKYKRHIDQILEADPVLKPNAPDDNDESDCMMPDPPEVPVLEEPAPNAEFGPDPGTPAPSPQARRYPRRENRRPPPRYRN